MVFITHSVLEAVLQRISDGRVAVNIVTGGDPIEQRAYGDRLDDAERYERTAEYLVVWRRLWRGEEVSFEGRHIWTDGARPVDPPEAPRLYIGGASSAADAIAASAARFARMDSVAQRAMSDLNGGTRDALVVGPNLWAGIGLVREGAGTALVGSYEEVAARLLNHHDVGIDEFVLSGYPHLEESVRFGEFVRPAFERRLAERHEAHPALAGLASA